MEIYKIVTATVWFCFYFQLCSHNSTKLLATAAPVTLVTATKLGEHITKREINSPGQTDEADQEFLSRIERAVNMSFSQLSIDEIKKNLTRNIVRELIEDEMNSVQCKPRSKTYLGDLFINSNAPSCLQLSLHHNTTTLDSSEEEYVVSANTSCRGVPNNQQCVFQHSTACPSSTSIHTITPSQSHEYFPRYMLNVDCHGCSVPYSGACSSQAPGCFYEEKTVRFNLLKKSKECDSEGYDKWITDDHLLLVNGGCSCMYAGWFRDARIVY